MDTNRVILTGQVNFITFGNTKHGKRYCRFTLNIKNSDGSFTNVFCICFDKDPRDYLDHKVVNGDKVELQGVLTSYKKEIPGAKHALNMNSVRVSSVKSTQSKTQMSKEYSERGSLEYEPDPSAEEDLDRDMHLDMPF
jgi:hypothetical protein